MKIVIASDSFKESLTAPEACAAMAEGVRRVLPEAEIVQVPMADGGEGTVEAMVNATGGTIIPCNVTGPLGETVQARFGRLGNSEWAVIEMAAASGLELVPPEMRNPLKTTTFGTGELIRAALEAGCKKLIIGIGGSATVDGGVGAARALGVRFLDEKGNSVGTNGGDLEHLTRIDATEKDRRLAEVECFVACDVTNPLLGPTGAAAVFGPQKGATPDIIPRLEANLKRLAERIEKDLGISVAGLPGGGAAGGLGAGLSAFCNAKLERGVDLISRAVDLEGKLHGADLCLTGEGRLCSQTPHGKTAWGVAQIARSLNVPVFALTGSIEQAALPRLYDQFDVCLSIVNRPMPLTEALHHARELLTSATEAACRAWTVGSKADIKSMP